MTNDHGNPRQTTDDPRDLTSGPIWRKLLRLAGPMIFGIGAVMSVQVVDTFFVGQLGTEPLAALSFSFPIALTLASVSIGLSAGAASLVSRAIGRGDRHRTRQLASDSLLLTLVVVLVLTAAGLLTLEAVLGMLGASGEILDLAMRYSRIWYLSLPFLIVTMVCNAMTRAAGDAFWPSTIMVSSALLNVIVTPILVFGIGPFPDLGIEGAALATLLARVTSSLMALYLVIGRDRLVVLAWRDLRRFSPSARRVLGIGIPAALGNASNPLGMAIATAVIAVLGSETVAGFGVATRLEAFAILPMLAISASIGPVAGQNWGSDRADRVALAMKTAFGFCAGWALVLALFFWAFGQPIAALFSAEASVTEQATRYLWIVPISLWGYGIAIIAAGAFNALGKPLIALGYSLTRTAVFYVPLVWIASRLDGSATVYAAIAVANVLAGILVAVDSLHRVRRLNHRRTDA
ncbi:MAG: MATE family efflux transporter [Wenzhouxiangella sp.]